MNYARYEVFTEKTNDNNHSIQLPVKINDNFFLGKNGQIKIWAHVKNKKT